MSAIEDITRDMVSAGLLDKAKTVVENGIMEAMEAAFRAPVSPAALSRARRLASTAAESLTRQLTEAQLRSMGETIAAGLGEGKRPRDLYNRLREVSALDSNRAKRYHRIQEYLELSGIPDSEIGERLEREYQRLLRDRRKTIAHTEGRYATSEARALEAESRGDKVKAWVTSADVRVSDVCAGNEAQGYIPVSEAFASGHFTTPGHPNCRCTIAYAREATDVLKEWREQRIQQTAKAKGDE